MRQREENYVIPNIISAGTVKFFLCKTGWHMGMDMKYTRRYTHF
jgi:hypothetical protein